MKKPDWQVEVVLNNLRLKIQAYLAPPNLAHVDMLDPGNAMPVSRGGSRGGQGSGRSRIDREPTSRSLKSSGSGGRGGGGHMAPPPPMAGSPRIKRVARKPRDSPKMGKKTGRVAGGRVTPLSRGMTSASMYDHNPTSGSSYDRGARGGRDDPYDVINDQEQDLLDCRETISILQIKVEKLEQLLQLKDRKIDDMAQRLEGGGGGLRATRGYR